LATVVAITVVAIERNSGIPGSFFASALTAALIASVERMGLAVFDDEDTFYGSAKCPNRNSNEFKAVYWAARFDPVQVST
jgi:hypothetical protein